MDPDVQTELFEAVTFARPQLLWLELPGQPWLQGGGQGVRERKQPEEGERPGQAGVGPLRGPGGRREEGGSCPPRSERHLGDQRREEGHRRRLLCSPAGSRPTLAAASPPPRPLDDAHGLLVGDHGPHPHRLAIGAGVVVIVDVEVVPLGANLEDNDRHGASLEDNDRRPDEVTLATSPTASWRGASGSQAGARKPSRRQSFFRCRTCKTCARPQSARPAKPVPVLDFGDVLGIDVVHSTDGLSMIDYALTCHVVAKVKDARAKTLAAAVRDHWIAWAGPPRTFSLGLDSGFKCVFEDMCYDIGAYMSHSAGTAHWQHGLVERRNGVWKDIWDKMVESAAVSEKEVGWVLATAVGVRCQPQAASFSVESKLQRQNAIRQAARVAFLQVQTSEAMQRALVHKAASRSSTSKAGGLVYIFRERRPTKWLGPRAIVGLGGAELLGLEGWQVLAVCAGALEASRDLRDPQDQGGDGRHPGLARRGQEARGSATPRTARTRRRTRSSTTPCRSCLTRQPPTRTSRTSSSSWRTWTGTRSQRGGGSAWTTSRSRFVQVKKQRTAPSETGAAGAA